LIITFQQYEQATTHRVVAIGHDAQVCGYIESTDNAGNTSAPSAIKNALAL